MPFLCGMEDSMVQWPRFRARCLHFALIALSIQGITPDSRDLTSGSISWILRSILNDGIPAAADDAAPGDDAPDETPDDVCTPASADVRIGARVRIAHPYPPYPVRLVPFKLAAALARTRSPRDAAATCRRLASLCRFTC